MGFVPPQGFTPVILSVIAVAFSIYTFYCNIIHDKKKNTLDAYNRLQEQVLDKLCRYTVEEINEIIKDPHSEEYKELSVYLARIEHFCVGIVMKIYDINTVYRLSHGFLDGAIKKRIYPLIDFKSCGNEDYYENTHKVMNCMEKISKRK